MPPRPQIPDAVKHLDLAAVEKALVEMNGNVTAASKVLRVPASDLRRPLLTRSSSNSSRRLTKLRASYGRV
jgi:hypothetical protein